MCTLLLLAVLPLVNDFEQLFHNNHMYVLEKLMLYCILGYIMITNNPYALKIRLNFG